MILDFLVGEDDLSWRIEAWLTDHPWVAFVALVLGCAMAGWE